MEIDTIKTLDAVPYFHRLRPVTTDTTCLTYLGKGGRAKEGRRSGGKTECAGETVIGPDQYRQRDDTSTPSSRERLLTHDRIPPSSDSSSGPLFRKHTCMPLSLCPMSGLPVPEVANWSVYTTRSTEKEHLGLRVPDLSI